MQAIEGTRVSFCNDLRRNIEAAERKLDRVLSRIDRFIDETRMYAERSDRRPAIRTPDAPSELDLRDAKITTVLWATGYRRRYPWLHVPVLNICGEIIHEAGVTPAPGLYALGLNYQRTRKSSFIDGVGNDARYLAEQLTHRLNRSSIAA
jgi:putative flavoprotein involved in K+ transport